MLQNFMPGSTTTSYDHFAQEYDAQMGESGDIFHEHKIDPMLFGLLGDVSGMKIYDFGCGNGYIDNKLLQMGATQVFASDVSPKLIELANARFAAKYPDRLKFFVSSGDDFSYFNAEFDRFFDVVVSNMAIHYIADLDKLAAGLAKILKPGGKFVCTFAHPLDDFKFHQNLAEWKRQKTAKDYLTNYTIQVAFFKDKPFTIYKRPLKDYINIFVANGFVLTGIEEVSKFTSVNGERIDTEIPAFIGLSFLKN